MTMPGSAQEPPRRAGTRARKRELELNVGFQYYISFKPNTILEEAEVQNQVGIEVSISVTENGELADVTFEIPKLCQSEHVLDFIKHHENASYVPPRVFLVVPGREGDTVLSAAGNLELDLEGRIVGLEIQWSPAEEAAIAEP